MVRAGVSYALGQGFDSLLRHQTSNDASAILRLRAALRIKPYAAATCALVSRRLVGCFRIWGLWARGFAAC